VLKREERVIREALEAVENAQRSENALYWLGIAEGRLRDVLGEVDE
jgi:hypothetical protein